MKNVVLALVLAAFVVVSVIFVRPKIQQVSETYTAAEQYLGKARHLQSLLEVNTQQLQQITSQWEKSQKEIREYTEAIERQQEHIQNLEAQIQHSEYEIPDIPQTIPEDLQDCLAELHRSRQTSEELIKVVYAQREQNTLKMELIGSQGVIIESQANIIERQSDYINEFETLIEQHRKRSNRNILIGVGLGIAVGLFI